MKSPICAVILLLALAQINATAGLECRCMKRFINLATKQFIADKETWLDEEEEALADFEIEMNPAFWPIPGRDDNRGARAKSWPGCEASKCVIERGNDIWKLRFEQLRHLHQLDESQLKPACLEANSTVFAHKGLRGDVQEFSCGFDSPALRQAINNASGENGSQDRNCTGRRTLGGTYGRPTTTCLVRAFDLAKDTGAVRTIDRSGVECRCKLRYTTHASKEFITDTAKWEDETVTAYSEAYKFDYRAVRKDRFTDDNDWPGCEHGKCYIEPGSEFWNRRKKQLEKQWLGIERVPAYAEPACLRIRTSEDHHGSGLRREIMETEQFVCGFKFWRLENRIDGPGGSRRDDGNCTAEAPIYGGHRNVTICTVRAYEPQKDAAAATEAHSPATDAASGNEAQEDAAAATSPIIAMVAVIQLLMLIANKLQIVATGPD